MNKLVTRHLSLVTAALVAVAASARTVSVAAVKDGAATAAFGDADGATYTLAWGYGPADGGADTNDWAHFETLGEVADGDTSRSVALPAGWGETATHLRFFLLEPEIPAGATRVEYIEATGTQWIDTGVNLYSNDTVVAEYEYPNPIVGKNNYLFGVYKQGMTAGYFYSNSGSYPLRFQKANGTSGATTTEAGINATPGARQTVTMRIASDATTTIVSASGDTLYSGVLGGTIRQDATAPLALFTANISGSPSSSYTSAAKIYSFRIFDKDGALRLDFVPCTDGNGDPAMFDLVSGNYFHNGGSGSFSTGAAMPTPLLVATSSATASSSDYGTPDAYLDYVEATGTQIVNTECLLASNSVIVAEYAYPDPIVGHANYLFGVYKSGMTAGYFYSNSGSYPLRFQKATGTSGATSTEAGINATPGARQTVTMRLASGATSTVVSTSGETLYSGALAGTISRNATAPLVLLGLNNQGNLDSGYACSAKIYSFRIYDGDGNLARHFLPCLKNGVAGFYDKVSGKIFRSATATALVAGPQLPRPAEFVTWVQSDGADGSRGLYIDTGVPAKAGVGMVAEMEWTSRPSVQSAFCGASNGSKNITLYTSAGTHQMGYDTWTAQIQGGGNTANAGVRYLVSSHLAASDQYLNVKALDGSGYDGTRTYNTVAAIDAGNNLYLFARNDAGIPNQLSSARLYSLVLTNDLGVVRDFVPCVADNGRAGLYDRVSERVFFPQAAVANAAAEFDFATEVGASTNSVGMAGAPLARLSYVESDGASDFVDLGVIGKDGTKMVVDVEWTIMPDDDVLCGARAGNNRFLLYNSYNNLHSYCYANGAPTIGAAGAPVLGQRYRVTTVLAAGSQSCSVQTLVDGSWSEAKTRDDVNAAGPVDTGLPLYLFARNMDGTADSFAGARVYSLKLWQKDGNGDYQLVRDLVPAKAPDGQPALYDRVSTGWLRNAGRYALSGGTESVWRDGFIFAVW